MREIARIQEEEEAQTLDAMVRDAVVAKDLFEREAANDYIRAQSRSRAANENMLRERVQGLFEDPNRNQMHLNHLTDEEQVLVQRFCQELSESGRCSLHCKLQEHGERLLLTKKYPRTILAPPPPPPAAAPARPVEPEPPMPTPLPTVDYNAHFHFNEHGVRVMQPVRLVVQPAPPVVAPLPLLEETPPAAERGSQPAGPTAPYDDIPDDMWKLVYSLPFRVKYEVEVLVGLQKLVRWKFLPEAFLVALQKCVYASDRGETVCTAALRLMATQKIGRCLEDFELAQERLARMPHLGRARQPRDASVATQRSVEVLSCLYCCPGGRVIVRAAEYQSSNRVLRLVGDFCGTDALLRVSFVNEGTLTPVNRSGIPDRAAAGHIIAQYWRERRFQRRTKANASSSTRIVRPVGREAKWDAVMSALRDGIRVGGELFRWLAPSSSQMKSMGMWFVRETEGVSAPLLRRSLGDFAAMKTAAIYLARLGQCLSGTHRERGVEPRPAH